MYVKEKENMHISCTRWDIFRARMKCAVVCTNVMAQKEPDAVCPLTICDLQLSLGEDAACNGQGLADIVTGVSPLHG